ncbi:MAG: T9SS type A sorting domain-containing protein [Ignavibacteriae bacterium]|nr:T9SS type A sorting domain-containing protein [Ignavibacteriota bacterium]
MKSQRWSTTSHRLVDEVQGAGTSASSVEPFKAVQFDAGSLASGVYLYRLQSGSYVETKKCLVLR